MTYAAHKRREGGFEQSLLFSRTVKKEGATLAIQGDALNYLAVTKCKGETYSPISNSFFTFLVWQRDIKLEHSTIAIILKLHLYAISIYIHVLSDHFHNVFL